MPKKKKTILPKVSVVVRCFNEEKYLDRLLKAIFIQEGVRVEVVVVDSGSTDSTLKIASKYPVKITKIAFSDFSFGKSLNIGCKQSRGQYLVIASAHVFPTSTDWLRKMIKPFENFKIGLVYGRQVGDKSTKFSEHQIFHELFETKSDYDQKSVFCNNANSAIRKKIWRNIKYDENLSGLEDIDWSKKIKSIGYKIAYLSEAEVIHTHNESNAQVLNRYKREANAYKIIFPKEKFDFFQFIKLYLVYVVSDIKKTKKQGGLLRNFLSILVFRLMQFWGTFLGYRSK